MFFDININSRIIVAFILLKIFKFQSTLTLLLKIDSFCKL